jgi:hypothetical protein
MSTRKSKKKKQLLVKTKEPFFIHKEVKGTNLTFMIGEYALPWKAITNVPPCDAAINEDRLKKLKKAFPDAHIEFNFNREAPAFLFRAIGRTKRCGGDEQNQSVGDAVARAKATARACVISKAIIKSAMSGLEEELKRNLRIFDEWREKEREIVKGV